MPTNIDELLAMEAKATPGPWLANSHGVDTPGQYTQGNKLTNGREEFPGDDNVCVTRDGEYIENHKHEEDAAFIAALRNAAPDLLELAQATRDYQRGWQAHMSSGEWLAVIRRHIKIANKFGAEDDTAGDQ